MTLAQSREQNYSEWEKIYQTTSFLVGRSDDPGYYEYAPLLKEVYGPRMQLEDLIGEEAKWQTFMKKARNLKGPAINSLPVFDQTIQPDREREIKGFRFMGQRFTLDASIFQRLIYREVGENPQGQRRMLPRGLDIPAAMGSAQAYSLLKSMGETSYSGYPQNMKKMQTYIKGLDANTWQQNLYWSWLYTLQPLTTEKGAGFPSFMRNKAWSHKELNTYLASWTELKHDTILYSKQNYAEMGGGDFPTDDRGYVEPNPWLYSRLANLTALTRDGLQSRGLLSERDKNSLDRLEELALSLKNISIKELENQPLSDEEYELIRSYGGQLEHFWIEALRDSGIVHRSQLCDNPAALVADVATAPPDLVLEEGTGMVASFMSLSRLMVNCVLPRAGFLPIMSSPGRLKSGLLTRSGGKCCREKIHPHGLNGPNRLWLMARCNPSLRKCLFRLNRNGHGQAWVHTAQAISFLAGAGGCPGVVDQPVREMAVCPAPCFLCSG